MCSWWLVHTMLYVARHETPSLQAHPISHKASPHAGSEPPFPLRFPQGGHHGAHFVDGAVLLQGPGRVVELGAAWLQWFLHKQPAI